jgi:hypothetical protein
MNIKKITISSVAILLFIFTVNAGTHTYIGLNKEEIKTRMQHEMDDFNLDNSSINKTYNYLKYVDYLGQQTILYFLDENNMCTASKWICDYSLLNEKRDYLNKEYEETGEDTWVYKDENEIYNIKLERENWFFAIITRPEK